MAEFDTTKLTTKDLEIIQASLQVASGFTETDYERELLADLQIRVEGEIESGRYRRGLFGNIFSRKKHRIRKLALQQQHLLDDEAAKMRKRQQALEEEQKYLLTPDAPTLYSFTGCRLVAPSPEISFTETGPSFDISAFDSVTTIPPDWELNKAWENNKLLPRITNHHRENSGISLYSRDSHATEGNINIWAGVWRENQNQNYAEQRVILNTTQQGQNIVAYVGIQTRGDVATNYLKIKAPNKGFIRRFECTPVQPAA